MNLPIKLPLESEDSFSFHTYRATKRGPGTDEDRVGDIVVPTLIQELRSLADESVSRMYASALHGRADELRAWLDARDKERAQ